MSGTHDDLVVLAPAYVLGALEPDERRAFETHLAGVRRLRVGGAIARARDGGSGPVGAAGDAASRAARSRAARRRAARDGAPTCRREPRSEARSPAMGDGRLAGVCGVRRAGDRRRSVCDEPARARREPRGPTRAGADASGGGRPRDGRCAPRRVRDAVGDGGARRRGSHARRSAGRARRAASRRPRVVEPPERHGVRRDESAAAARRTRSIRCGSWPADRR